MPCLPPELCDKVIDYLQNDFPALDACSLTCRNWVPRARYHRFWTVHVGPDSCETLLNVLTQPKTKTPNIGPLVHHLIVTAYGRCPGNGPEEWIHGALENLVKEMPNVQCLSLHALDMATIEWPRIGRCLPNLEILDLHHVQVCDKTSIPMLFVAFPKLCDIACDSVFNSQRPDLGDFLLLEGQTPAAATLTHLNVKQQYYSGDPFVRRLLKWLFARKLHKKLRVLQIDGLDAPLLEPFSKLVSDIGPDLRTLGISFDNALTSSVELEHVSALKRCTNLRTFELLPLKLGIPHPWVCALLESIPHAELRKVNVKLMAGSIVPADYANVDLAGMAKVLAEFPKLRHVAFTVLVSQKEVGPPLKTYILSCMAPLVPQDRVKVRVSLVQNDADVVVALRG